MPHVSSQLALLIYGRDKGYVAEQIQVAGSASMIVPVIKRQAPPSDDAVVLPPEFNLMSDALTCGLNVFYAFDFPGHFEYVSAHDCRTLEIAPGALRGGSSEPDQAAQKAGDSAAVRRCRDAQARRDLEASLLLVNHLWLQLGRGLPGETVVALPSRDVLVASGTHVTGGIETLHRAVKRRWENPTTDRKLLLTRQLLVRRDTSWQVYES